MDPITQDLKKIEVALVNDAEAAGEGPLTMRKSNFRSEMERASFISAYGQKNYDKLKD